MTGTLYTFQRCLHISERIYKSLVQIMALLFMSEQARTMNTAVDSSQIALLRRFVTDKEQFILMQKSYFHQRHVWRGWGAQKGVTVTCILQNTTPEPGFALDFSTRPLGGINPNLSVLFAFPTLQPQPDRYGIQTQSF